MIQATFSAKPLNGGTARGRALVLEEPLSFWGGLDPESGEIIDRRHPQTGQIVTGRVLLMPRGRGSSSASSILLEAVKAGTAPAAIAMAENDPILALGAVVARELYGDVLPVVVVEEYEVLCEAALQGEVVVDGDQVRVVN